MPGVHEGYEPNPLALRVFALWGLMERSRSVPFGRSPGALDDSGVHGASNDDGFQVNPFYSEKVKENMMSLYGRSCKDTSQTVYKLFADIY